MHLDELGYDHRTVCHADGEYSRNDPDGITVTTNGGEGVWGNMKIKHRSMRGSRKNTLDKFLNIFCWRSRKVSIFDVVRSNAGN